MFLNLLVWWHAASKLLRRKRFFYTVPPTPAFELKVLVKLRAAQKRWSGPSFTLLCVFRSCGATSMLYVRVPAKEATFFFRLLVSRIWIFARPNGRVMCAVCHSFESDRCAYASKFLPWRTYIYVSKGPRRASTSQSVVPPSFYPFPRPVRLPKYVISSLFY